MHLYFLGPLNNTTKIIRYIHRVQIAFKKLYQPGLPPISIAIIYSNYVNFTIGTNKAYVLTFEALTKDSDVE